MRVAALWNNAIGPATTQRLPMRHVPRARRPGELKINAAWQRSLVLPNSKTEVYAAPAAIP
jgi:hypothetical protein